MDFSRQNMIEGLTVPKIASVVGCGGTGFWVALLLAMQGTQEIILFDDDVIESSNLARLPVGSSYVGYSKLDAIGALIGSLRNIRLEYHKIKVDSPERCRLLRGVVFCCTDNIPSQQLIHAYCKKNGLNYQRVGYDGTTLCVTRSFPLTFEDPNKLPAGYEVTPSWVVPCVIAAAAGISSQCLQGGDITLMDDIRRLHIQDCSNMTTDMAEKLKIDGRKDIMNNPGDFGFGKCDDCDRSNCDDCNKISDDDYDTMHDIVCEDCDYISPDNHEREVQEARDAADDDAWQEAIDMINGKITMANTIKAAIDANYIPKPKDIPGQRLAF
jgi:molybdopterin/thiamine biosynthesis adenylyltransferase